MVISVPLLGLFLIVGGTIGFFSGLIGIGGGSFMIPALVIVFAAAGSPQDLAVKMAFGTNLVVGSFTALAGFMVHKQHLTGQWDVVVPLASTSVVGAICGSTAASHLPGSLLRVLFGIAAAVVAVAMFRKPGNLHRAKPTLPLILLLPLGLTIGFAASLVGLGGAVFTTIALVAILKYPMRHVVGVSTFVQTVGALFGALGYMVNGLGVPGLPRFSVGYVNLLAAGAMMAAGVPLARVGARLTHRIEAATLKRVFGVALLMVAFFMIWGAR